MHEKLWQLFNKKSPSPLKTPIVEEIITCGLLSMSYPPWHHPLVWIGLLSTYFEATDVAFTGVAMKPEVTFVWNQRYLFWWKGWVWLRNRGHYRRLPTSLLPDCTWLPATQSYLPHFEVNFPRFFTSYQPGGPGTVSIANLLTLTSY